MQSVESGAKDRPRLAGVILAAGGSSRLGQPKQAVLWRGKPLVLHALDRCLSSCDAGVVVVTGASRELVGRLLIGSPVRQVHNARWVEGLATSLRCGIEATSRDAEGLLIMLCDQPYLQEEELAGLVARWRGQPTRTVAAAYGDTIGVPAIIPRGRFTEIAMLVGDQGAKALLQADEELLRVPVPSAAFDVDDPGDLAELCDDDA